MSAFISKADSYDERLLEGRISAEAAVLGLIMNDMNIFIDYKITSDFFLTKDGLFLFKLLETLHSKNVSQITEFDVLNTNEIIYEKFMELGGMRLIESMKSNVELNNYASYIDELYKHKAILDLTDNMGVDLLKEVNFNGRKIIPIEEFKKYTSEQVREYYDYHVNEICVFSMESGNEEMEIDLDDDFLNSCESGSEMGVMFDIAGKNIKGNDIYVLPGISKQIGGYLKGTLNCIAGYSNIGKSTLTNSIIFSLVSKGCNVLFISNEQKAKVFKTSYTLWILANRLCYYNITRQKLRSGNLTDEDKIMLKKAQQIWRDDYKGKIHFVGINEANMKVVTKKIREYKARKGIDVVVYDTFKADFENNNDADWKSLIRDSRELFKTVKKYDVIGICTMQLAPGTKGRLFLNESVLANGKQVKEVMETMLLFRGVYNEEELNDKSKFYSRPFKRTKIGDEWISKKVDVDKNKVYRMLFVDKAREGETSENTGESYLLGFDGSKGLFHEICKCKPKHMIIQ